MGRALSAGLVTALVGAGLLWGACTGGSGRGPSEGMELTSPAFEDGGRIPERYSCEGENLPPPLRWTAPPAGTTEVALVVEDPAAPGGTFVNWIVAGIDPGVRSTGSGPPPAGAVQFEGSSDMATYIGPCPPDGDGAHRYRFQVYALDARPRLAPGSGPVETVQAIRAAAIAGGVLVGTFER